MNPVPAAVEKPNVPRSNDLPEKTSIGATVPPVVSVPDGEFNVKLSSARIPPTRMPLAPLPVPLEVAKTAVLLGVKALVKGPELVTAYALARAMDLDFSMRAGKAQQCLVGHSGKSPRPD